MKWNYTSFNSQAVSSSGSITALAAIANGTGYNGRLSTRIWVDKITVRLLTVGSLQSTIATADIYNNVRVILALAKGPISGVTTGDMPSATAQIDFKEPFMPLYDRTVFLQNLASGLAAAGSAYGPSPQGVWLQDAEGGAGQGYFTIKVGKPITFDNTSGSSDADHMPFIYLVSDSTVTPNPTVSGEVRVFYRDMVDSV